MSDPRLRTEPGVVLAGCGGTWGLVLLAAAAVWWSGGDFTFVVPAMLVVLGITGGTVMVARPFSLWRSVGYGMVIGAVIAGVLIYVTLWLALDRWASHHGG